MKTKKVVICIDAEIIYEDEKSLESAEQEIFKNPPQKKMCNWGSLGNYEIKTSSVNRIEP